jgi:hypothetical protein
MPFVKPDYCKYDKLWCVTCYDENSKYKGKYMYSECTHCHGNSLRAHTIYTNVPKIKIVMNTSNHHCPCCYERFKEKEYVIDLGSYGKKNFLHINCLDKFIENLVKFKQDELPDMLKKVVAKMI